MGCTHRCLHCRVVGGASGVFVARPLEDLALKVGMLRLALLCFEVLHGGLSREAPLHEHSSLHAVVVAMLSALAGCAKVGVSLISFDRA